MPGARFLGAVLIIIAFSIYTSRRSKKVVSSEWKGRVTEIRHQRTNITRDEDRQENDWVTVLYRTDAGTDGKLKIRLRVMRQFLAGLNVGDELVKRKGNHLPRLAGIDAPAEAAGEAAA